MRHSGNSIYRRGTDEEIVERALRIAGLRQEPPNHLQEITTAAFRDELDKVIEVNKVRGKPVEFLLAVACSCLFLIGYYFMYPLFIQGEESFAAQIEYAVGANEMRTLDVDDGRLSVAADTWLESGSMLTTSEEAYLAFDFQGATVRMNQQSQVQVFDDHLMLKQGSIYIDSNAIQQPNLLVKTTLAEVRDIGTQFLVSVTGDQMSSVVRDGQISVKVSGVSYEARASEEFGERISISAAQTVETTRASKTGEDWAWIVNASEKFKLEGAKVSAFLDWVANETGKQIVYDTRGTELKAESTILHGDFGSVRAEDLDLVLSATELRADISADDLIQVHSL